MCCIDRLKSKPKAAPKIVSPRREKTLRIMLLIGALSLAYCAHAIERKPILQVDVNALTTETQVMAGGANSIDVVWWIPVEFWEATLRQSGDVPESQVDQMLGVLQNHTVLGVVQADISPFGAFRFFDKDKVMGGLKVQAIDAAGKLQTISHTEPVDPDMRLLLDQMRPVLAQAMGNLGENFYFFPLPAFDDEGERISSPYESGRLLVTLQRGEAHSSLEIEMPIDSLFVPRICPNGKPAHVSWAYCPWSGKKLQQ